MIRRAINKMLPGDDAPGAIVRVGVLADLRRHRGRDVIDFMQWYQDEDIAQLLRHDLRPLSAGQARNYFESIVLPASARGTAWAITDHESTNLLGTTAVTEINEKNGSCLFRIVIGEKQAWGHGFGTDATRLVAAEVFETLGLQVMNLEVFLHNPRAIRAYERVGFRETGRSVEWTRNQRLDVIAMQLRKEEWDQTYASDTFAG